ncbi:MAG: hypothetical protein HRT97_10115 [Moritella sp.]|uniref:hypothetical protein n=1 Tax=Moritella sp. TaxID=78556 RepID=UPI0025FE8F16|nr:hypothetical protein [Moritella sp.]NQZ92682.1 hypothetical protein [Moritella sp.]
MSENIILCLDGTWNRPDEDGLYLAHGKELMWNAALQQRQTNLFDIIVACRLIL